VARAVGISPETARAVRAELRGGPVRPAARPADRTVEDWAATVRRLRDDPALRFSETGRALLRLLDLHALSTDHWAAMVRTVPAYNRPAVARVALECARVWRAVAEGLIAEDLSGDHRGGTSDGRHSSDHVVSVADPGRAAGQRRALGRRPAAGRAAHP
jgi:hypothetical protein